MQYGFFFKVLSKNWLDWPKKYHKNTSVGNLIGVRSTYLPAASNRSVAPHQRRCCNWYCDNSTPHTLQRHACCPVCGVLHTVAVVITALPIIIRSAGVGEFHARIYDYILFL